MNLFNILTFLRSLSCFYTLDRYSTLATKPQVTVSQHHVRRTNHISVSLISNHILAVFHFPSSRSCLLSPSSRAPVRLPMSLKCQNAGRGRSDRRWADGASLSLTLIELITSVKTRITTITTPTPTPCPLASSLSLYPGSRLLFFPKLC